MTARADLESAGFAVAVVDQDTADPSQDGLVVDQTPAPGERAAAGSKVIVYMGRFGD